MTHDLVELAIFSRAKKATPPPTGPGGERRRDRMDASARARC